MSNPIIAIAREVWDSQDAWAHAAEWTFQMCRLADEHEVEHGVDYHDPSKPLTLDWAVSTGEDSAYWDAVLALWEDQKILPDVDPSDHYTQALATSWRQGGYPEGYDFDRASDHIRVALKTFHRILRLADKEN